MISPQVSIITATFNSSKTILDTYNSILMQDLKDWEWLVTDDCSTDETVLILRELSNKDDRVKFFINKVNSGAAISRNNSMSASKGDFLAFIDSDDRWKKGKLVEQIKFMEDNNVDFSFTPYTYINECGEALNKIVDLDNISSVGYEELLKKKVTLGCSTVIIRKSAFINDLSMPNIRTGQDYAFWLKLLKQGSNARLFNSVLTEYRIMPNSISRNKLKKAKRQWEIYRSIEGLNLMKSLNCFVNYSVRAVFRK